MSDAQTSVLHALIDAVFKTGGIGDQQRNDLHGQLDAAGQPAPALEPPAADAGLAFGTEEAPGA